MSSIFTVTLPDIGEGVVEGEVIQWLKKEGETCGQDEPVVIVMTDKATVELPAPHPGILSKHYYKVGEIAKLDHPLYDITLHTPLQTASTSSSHHKAEKKPSLPPPSSAPKPSPKPTTSTKECSQRKCNSGKALAIPKVRFLAKELEIDLEKVQGSGKEGRVTKEDLIAYIKGSSFREPVHKSTTALPPLSYPTTIPSLPGDRREPIFGIRNLIVEKMVESKYIVPHFTFGDKFDGTRLVQLRDNIKREALKEGLRVTFMPFYIRALSLCLEKYPILNSSVDHVNKEIVYRSSHNIGIAMKTTLGTVIPVLKEVQGKSLEQIIRQFNELISKARENKLAPHEMKHSTFTISNFGAIGGSWGTPVINYPEVAILGIGKMEETAVVKRGEITKAPVTQLCWSCDHRVIDGDVIASLSNEFVQLLEHPSKLL